MSDDADDLFDDLDGDALEEPQEATDEHIDDDSGIDLDLPTVDVNWRRLGALAFVAGIVLVIPAIAGVLEGPLIGGLVLGLTLTVGLGVPISLALFGPSIPAFIGLPVARGLWILAQLTVGTGVLVERDTGDYEHHKLHRAPAGAEHDWECRLSNGERLQIDGERGDLLRFGWAPLGITAQKTPQNMDKITETPSTDAVADGGEIITATEREGYRTLLPVPDDDEWLVTLPQLWNWCGGSGESENVRQGREKALTQQGGQQKLSTLVLLMLTLVGMGLGAVTGLVAGGAL